MKIHCPECQGIFRVEGQGVGSEFDCPFCQAKFSFRDKETIVATRNPQTQVRFEVEDPALAGGTPPEAAGSPLHDSERVTVGVPPQAPSDYTDFEVGDNVAGYVLEEVIGWGGMSVVFRAKQVSLERNVAVKVLRKDLAEDPEFSQRFLKEAKALAELSHPNIVQVFDQGVHQGNHFLVMEFIDGVSLREVLNEKRLAPEEAIKVVPALCSALDYAHSRGIVHRDIKPENLMLTRDGVPKIADFGLVRMLGRQPDVSRLTKTQTIMGTIEYMAPEQREGSRDIDHRADIYSLGVVLYEMLTGELPIARFPLPSEKLEVDVRLDEVVLKVLEKDRDRRYQRASMVATDLQDLGATKQASVGTHSPPTRKTIGQRVLTLIQSPLFFLFTLVFLAAAIGDADEEFLIFLAGVGVPFCAAQLALHGLLPRPVLSRDQFFYRHPLLMCGALVIFSLILQDALEEGSIFLAGFFISAGLSTALWRGRIFRESGAPAFITPSVPASRGPRGQGRMASNKAGDVSRPQEKQSTGEATAVAAMGQRGALENEPPPVPEQVKMASAAASQESDGPTRTAAAHSPPETERRPRLSWLVVIGFLLTLVTTLYAGALWIGTQWFDWESILTYAGASYYDVDEFLTGVWQLPPAAFKNGPTMFMLAALIPLTLPGIINLVALIPLQSPHKRGGWLLSTSWAMLLVQALALVIVSGQLHRGVEHYHMVVEEPHTELTVLESADAAFEADDPLTRMALFHRVVHLAGQGFDVPYQTRLRIFDAAVNRQLTPIERLSAMVVLEHLHPEGLFEEDSARGQEWKARCIRAGQTETHRELKTALLRMLATCEEGKLQSLFWSALTSDRHTDGKLAVEWWSGHAPMESVEWLGTRYRQLDPRVLKRWVGRLKNSRNHRFSSDFELREALLEPLLDHPDLPRAELRQLIEYGPQR